MPLTRPCVVIAVLACSTAFAATPSEREARASSVIRECLGAAELQGAGGRLACVSRPYQDCEANTITQRDLNECAAIAREAWRVQLAEQLERTRTYIDERTAFEQSQMEWEQWSRHPCDVFAPATRQGIWPLRRALCQAYTIAVRAIQLELDLIAPR